MIPIHNLTLTNNRRNTITYDFKNELKKQELENPKDILNTWKLWREDGGGLIRPINIFN